MDTLIRTAISAGAVALLAAATILPLDVSANRGLQVRPLSYETVLQPDERQQGVVDVSNPSDEAVTLSVSVKGFRETENGLEFYNDPQIAGGIRLDHNSLTLQGKEAYRLVFEADAARLPSGEVRAAVLFTTNYIEQEMVAQQVSVGTLLQINNRQPAPTSVENVDDSFIKIVLIGAGAGLLLAVIVETMRRTRKKLVLKRSN